MLAFLDHHNNGYERDCISWASQKVWNESFSITVYNVDFYYLFFQEAFVDLVLCFLYIAVVQLLQELGKC